MQVIFAADCREAFGRAGMEYPQREPEPGRLCRFPTNGRADDAAGWLRIFPDQDGAAFGDWRSGAAFTWQRERAGPPPDAAELAAIRAKAQAVRDAAEAEREESYRDAAHKARATWQAAAPTEGHPYLSGKGIGPHIARERGGWLVIPVHDNAGNIQSVQSVSPTGQKLFMPGGKMAGGRCWLGDPTESGPLVLCEGFATGASIREATGWPVCVAFTAGNLRQVACDLRERFPRARMVIAGDDDRATPGNPGRTKALEAARLVNATTIFPSFDGADGSDFNDLAQQSGLEAVRRLIADVVEPPQRFRLMTADEIADLPPVRWRVRGALPQEGIAAIYGPPGSGKSFLALDVLGAIATGRPWFGYRVHAAPVLYIALEGEAGIAQRVQAHQARHGGAERMRFLAAPLDVRKPTDRTDIVRAAKAAGLAGGVLCIDTLAASAPGMDENTSSDMGEVISGMKALQAELGGLVLAVHHSGKDQTRGLRGHSSLLGALDAVIEVSRNDDRREWRTAKSKDGSDGDAHPFRLDVVELATDDDGEPVTSCVVEPTERPAEGIRRAALPGGGNMRLAFDAIAAALKDARAYGKASAPPGRPCIELEAAIDAAASRLPCDPKRRRERAQSAVTGLVSRGNLGHQEGWVWLP